MVKRILVALVGVPFLLAVLVWAPDWATAVLLCALGVIAGHELLGAVCGQEKARRWEGLSGVLAIFTTFAVYWSAPRFMGLPVEGIMPCFLAAVLVVMFCLFVVKNDKGNTFTLMDVCGILLGGVAIPLALSCLLRLRMMEQGGALVLIPLVAAFCSDTMALFTGMALGRHKLAPRVSPHKTVEGSIGGLLGGVVGMLLFRLIFRLSSGVALDMVHCAVLGLVGAAMGQLGDLVFSAVKREFGIKDYGKLLPGHGGVLDRFDSVIFAAPVLWMILRWMGW